MSAASQFWRAWSPSALAADKLIPTHGTRWVGGLGEHRATEREHQRRTVGETSSHQAPPERRSLQGRQARADIERHDDNGRNGQSRNTRRSHSRSGRRGRWPRRRGRWSRTCVEEGSASGKCAKGKTRRRLTGSFRANRARTDAPGTWAHTALSLPVNTATRLDAVALLGYAYSSSDVHAVSFLSDRWFPRSERIRPAPASRRASALSKPNRPGPHYPCSSILPVIPSDRRWSGQQGRPLLSWVIERPSLPPIPRRRSVWVHSFRAVGRRCFGDVGGLPTRSATRR
jgi:hypothetical protein